MTDFDMQKAKEICENTNKLSIITDLNEIAYNHSMAAKMLPVAIVRIEELESILIDAETIRVKQLERGYDELKAVIRHRESELIKSNHAYLDLQNITDDQAKYIAELEKALIEERANCIMAYEYNDDLPELDQMGEEDVARWKAARKHLAEVAR
jgi:hypothetical protein